jgi:hypothetical protein
MVRSTSCVVICAMLFFQAVAAIPTDEEKAKMKQVRRVC